MTFLSNCPERELNPPVETSSHSAFCDDCGRELSSRQDVYRVNGDWLCRKCFIDCLVDCYTLNEIADAIGIHHISSDLLAD